MEIAKQLIRASEAEGPLPKTGREELEALITSKGRRGPLTQQQLLLASRLSHRQLKRLNKLQLIDSDRRILKALEVLKEIPSLHQGLVQH